MKINDQLAWFDSLEDGDSYHAEAVKNDFAVAIHKKMQHIDLNQKGLAELMSSTPAHISKILRGDANLTIETMSKLARALSCDLHFHLATVNHNVDWMPHITSKLHQTSSGTVSNKSVAKPCPLDKDPKLAFLKGPNTNDKYTPIRVANGN